MWHTGEGRSVIALEVTELRLFYSTYCDSSFSFVLQWHCELGKCVLSSSHSIRERKIQNKYWFIKTLVLW